MTSQLIQHVNDDSFEADVLQSDKPVLVDFWADWCVPCKQIAPMIDELAASYSGKMKFAKINIDENPAVPGRLGIRGIPTLMVFKNGQLAATQVGALPRSQLTQFIDKQLELA